MRPLALLGLISTLALGLGGCGRSSPPTPTEPTGVTSAAEVASMTARLKEDEELRPVYKRERQECLATHESLANELTHEVGKACREALRTGSVFGPIEPRTIAECKRDIGR